MDISKYITNKDIQLSNDDINIEKLENDIIGEEFKQLLDLFMSAAGRKEKCRK